jgi:spermidine synthase
VPDAAVLGALSSRSAKALVFFTSGAVLVLEILAGRLLAPYVGVSLETFTGIIGTMLAGIALGASIGGRLADEHDPRRMLGPVLVAGGAASWLSLPIISAIGPSVGSDPVSIVIVTAFGFLVPATILSAVSPMVAKLELSNLDDSGSVVGDLSAAGTGGALFGTFTTGFVLAASFPTRPIVIGLGAVLVVLGAFLHLRLASVRPHPMAAVFLLGAFGLSASLTSPCDYETAYACVSVVDDAARPSGRSLILDDLRHSYVDLDDPTYLEFRYFRMFADVVDPMEPAGAIDVLNIGGAGFAFPRYITATRPGSTNLVLEIDDELVEIAQDELGVVLDDDLRVRVGDARLAFEELDDDQFDLVIGDAFGGRSVPWHLTTTEVVAEIDRVLRPDGIYVMNVIDGNRSRYARAQLATLREHFEHVAVIVPDGGVPVDQAVNQVLIASHRPLPEIDVDPPDGRLLSPEETVDYIGDSQVLRDDFAPVDQLAFSF